MLINRSKTAFENFVALIKESNPSFDIPTPEKVLLGLPVVDDFMQGRNTRITAHSVKNKGYSGERDLWYTRERMPNLVTAGWLPQSVEVVEGDTVRTLTDRIMANMGSLALEVVINEGDPLSIPAFGASVTYTVRPIATSIVLNPNTSSLVQIVNNFGQPFIEYNLNDYVRSPTIKNSKGSVNGTRVGAEPTQAVGRIGNAWNVNGGTAINTGYKTPAGAVSFSAWVTLASVNGRQAFFGDHPSDGTDASSRFAVGMINGLFEVRVNAGSGIGFIQSAGLTHGLTVGARTHIGVSIAADGKTIKLYRNGQLLHTVVSAVNKPNAASPNNMFIAQLGAYTAVKLGATTLDTVKVFNRELTAAEFQALGVVATEKNSIWSFSNRGPNTSLSADARIATASQVNQVKGDMAMFSGKRMFEMISLSSGNMPLFGVALSNSNNGGYTGHDDKSWGYYASTGNFYFNSLGITPGVAYGAPFAQGDVIGVCVDFTEGTLEFFKNGVSQGIASRDMAGKTLLPSFGSGTSAASGYSALLFTGEGGFAFPIPGALPWFD